METFVDFLEEQLQMTPLFEMTNLPPADTGLPYIVWLGKIGGQHGPRIKVSNVKGRYHADNSFVVSVSRTPKVLTPKFCHVSVSDLNLIFEWVQINYKTLMKIWNVYETGEGSMIPLYMKLKKVKDK